MTWNHIIDNMGKFAVDSLHLRDVFYRKIKDEPDMNWDIKIMSVCPRTTRTRRTSTSKVASLR
jgi:hypothetical protein